MTTTIYAINGFSGSRSDWDRFSFSSGFTDRFSIHPLFVPGHEGHACPSTIDETLSILFAQISSNKSSNGFYLMGYSMGGRLSLLMAESLLSMGLKGIILLASGLGIVDESEKERRLSADCTWARMLREAPSEFWNKWYEQGLFGSLETRRPKLYNEIMQSKSVHKIDELAKAIVTLSPAKHDYLDSMIPSSIPLLFLAGERDSKYRRVGEAIECDHELAAYAVVPGASHSLYWENPDFTSRLIETWLNSISVYQQDSLEEQSV